MNGPPKVFNSSVIYFSFQLTFCLIIHTWMLALVSSRVVQPQKLSSGRPREQNPLTFAPYENNQSHAELHNTSKLTKSTKDVFPILSRQRRSSNPCERKRERKWNHCLGMYFTKVHCRKSHVGCVLFNVPPRCKKNHSLVFGKNGRACSVVTSCSCA